MFDVSFSELVVIALVALVVLGPKRLPEVARTAGQWLARFRRFVSDVKQDFDREMQHADLAELHKLKQELDETRRTMAEASSRLMQQATIEPPTSSTSPNVPEPAAATSPSIAPVVAPVPAPTPSPVTPPASLSTPPAAKKRQKRNNGAKRARPKGKNGRPG